VAQATPQPETDWEYSAAFGATSAIKLSSHTEVMPLATAVNTYLSSGSQLHELSWTDRVFCTANFMCSVTSKPAA
jgi:hypothetical protein